MKDLNTTKHINIVSLDIPYPANYGGVIDIFYKIKYLNEAGYSIHLHTFEHMRERSDILEKFCRSVHYYKRKTGLISFLSLIPYIVNSRRSKALFENLLENDYPILFEGLHSCYYLDHPGLENRRKYVRAHNIEHIYYRTLSNLAGNFFNKLFFFIESLKLDRYEKVLNNADKILAISQGDYRYFSEKYGNTDWISAFHRCEEVSSIPGKGKYILMHGNLAVNENETSVIFAVENILNEIDFPVVIVGQNPSSFLTRVIQNYPRVRFIESPDDEEMDKLLKEAQIHLIFSFMETGLNLKLIHALFKGRFVLVNPPIINGTGLEKLVITGSNPGEIIRLINEYINREFVSEEIEKRKTILQSFGIRENIRKLEIILNP